MSLACENDGNGCRDGERSRAEARRCSKETTAASGLGCTPLDLGVHECQFFTDTTLWIGVFVFSIIILKCIYIKKSTRKGNDYLFIWLC